MDIKKAVKISIIFIVFFVLSGCIFKPKYDITDVDEAFEKLSTYDSVDMSFSISVKEILKTTTVKGDMIVKGNTDSPIVYMSSEVSGNQTQMYVINDYVYSNTNEVILVTKQLSTEVDSLSPIPEINYAELQYKFKAKKVENDIRYQITVDDKGLKNAVEEIIGESIGDIEISMDLIILVDKKTKDLRSLEYNIKVGKDASLIEVDMLITFNSLGEEVVLEVPSGILDEIDYFINNKEIVQEPDPVPVPDPEPVPVSYQNTSDGVVRFHDIGAFKNVFYDNINNVFVVIREDKIEILNSKTLLVERTITTPQPPLGADLEGDQLVVSCGTNEFYFYDLSSDSEPRIIKTYGEVSDIVIDGYMVFYTTYYYYSTYLNYYNLSRNEGYEIKSFYKPILSINRKDHIVYLTETGVSSSGLYYYDSQTAKMKYQSLFGQFRYVEDRPFYDGDFVHHEGIALDPLNGQIISSNSLTGFYHQYDGFIPEATLYNSDDISFIRSKSYQNKISIYNNIDNNYIYDFSIHGGRIIEMNNGQYLALSDNNYIAIVDTNKINDDIIDDSDDEKIDVIKTLLSGKLTSLETSEYYLSTVDDNYIYKINKRYNELVVYDIDTFNKVYSEKILMEATSIDVHSGKLVIGFGDAYQFRVYDTSTWKYRTVITSIPVYSVAVYNDVVYYAQVDQHCQLYSYNIRTGVNQFLPYSGYFVTFIINKKDGILYLGDRNSSSSDLTYYDLATNKYKNIFESYYNKTSVFFDGRYVHYANNLFDAITGENIGRNNRSREYQNISGLLGVKTIFDDGSISVFSAKNKDRYNTYVYDLKSNSVLMEIPGEGTNAYRVGNTIVVLNNENSIMVCKVT